MTIIYLLQLYLFFHTFLIQYMATANTCGLQNCLLCSSAGTCLQCKSTNYIALAIQPVYGCLPCRSSCKTCLNQLSVCQTCASGYYLSKLLTSQKCLKCNDNNCLECNSDNPQQCLTCSSTFYLDLINSKCEPCSIYTNAETCRQNIILTCSLGYYVFNGQSCQSCMQNCKQCSSSSYCLVCYDGYFGNNCSLCSNTCKSCLNNNTCLTCYDGKYRSPSTGKCLACIQNNCKTCDTNGICQYCQQQYYLNSQKQCKTITNQNIKTSYCSSYQQNKLQQLSQIGCNNCSNNYYLNINQNICLRCSLLCQQCTNYYQSSTCNKCSSYAYMIQSNICHIKQEYQQNNQKAIYYNVWNHPQIFNQQGQIQYTVASKSYCYSRQYSEKSEVSLGGISGYQFTIIAKIGILINTTNTNNNNDKLLIKFNDVLIQQNNVSLTIGSNQKSLNVKNQNGTIIATYQLSICSQLYNNISSYGVVMQLKSLASFGIIGNDISPTNNTITIQQQSSSNHIFFSFQEIIIKYKPCHASCYKCSQYSTCLQCSQNSQQKHRHIQNQRCVTSCSEFYYLYEPVVLASSQQSRCVLRCPIGTYKDPYTNKSWKCTKCPIQCSQCSSSNRCTACTQNYYLHSQSCLIKCPSRYYPNTVNRHCQACVPPCYTCQSQNTCLSCSHNFLDNSICVPLNGCPPGKYPNLSKLACLSCQSPCSQCIQRKDKCTQCESNYYLLDYRCVLSCPSYYLAKSLPNSCVKCQQPCLTCSQNISNCTYCKTGFLHQSNSNGSCTQKCPYGYYEYYKNMKCVQCQFPCADCIQHSSKCLQCSYGYILHQDHNQCIRSNQCVNTSFLINITNENGNQQRCILCSKQCSTCISWQHCLTCSQDYYFYSNTKQCLKSCPLAYYQSYNQKQCLPCSSNCASCKHQSDYCLSCQPNHHMDSKNFCVLGCQTNQLYPSCEKCLHPCYQCSVKRDQCVSCYQGYYWDQMEKKCLVRCQQGYYGMNYRGKRGGICLRCQQPCGTCTDRSNCRTCSNTEHYLLIKNLNQISGSCISSCPSRYYITQQSNICSPCIQPCLQCTSATQCKSCLNGVLYLNNCLQPTQCPYGTYPQLSSDNPKCLPCSNSCKNCVSTSNKCIQCNAGYYLNQYQCLSDCPINKYKSDFTKKCQLCSYPCLRCQGTATNCLTCKQPLCENQQQCTIFYLYNRQCLLDCPPGTYQSIQQQKCLQCLNPCKTCSTVDLCTTCVAQTYLLNNKCHQFCPDGYYPEQQTSACIKCVYPCKKCYNSSSCITCISGLKINDTCISSDTCLTSYYLQYSLLQDDFTCKQCSSQCLQCEGSPNQCTRCQNTIDKKLLNNQCLRDCPQHFYVSYSIQMEMYNCQLCPKQCEKCESYNVCLKCMEGYVKYEGICLQKCRPGFFQNQDSNCQQCSSQCKTCTKTPFNCLSCHTNNYFYQFKCLSQQCPDKTYKDQSSFICRQCTFPCQLCLNSRQCEQCVQGYYLLQTNDNNKVCIERCAMPMTVDEQNKKCVNSCQIDSYKIIRTKYNSESQEQTQQYFCSKRCQFPNIYSIAESNTATNDKCVKQCSSSQSKTYIDENLICKQLPTKLQNILTTAVFTIIMDANYTLKSRLQFSHEISYNITKLEQMLKLYIVLNSQEQSESRRLLFESSNILLEQLASQQQLRQIEYQITQQNFRKIQLKLDYQIFNQIDFRRDHLVVIKFNSNYNLLITGQISGIPLQNNIYGAILSKDLYQPYANYYQISTKNFQAIRSYRAFGQIIVGFLLAISLCLFLYNWYAKIYQSLHLIQLIFLLATLQLQYPPNLYYFLQGFKNSHFFFIGNWFIHGIDENSVAKSTPKIVALFGDCNLIRICGHLFGFAIILGCISLILFLSRFIPANENSINLNNSERKTNQQNIEQKFTFSKIKQALTHKFSLIKWSHIHDFIISTTMLVFFGVMVQTSDYSASTNLQIAGILFSYLVMALYLAYYFYMAHKLYKLIQLSKTDPNRFCDKNYLYRQNMTSITQSAMHPEQLYLNYLRAGRIILFGILVGSSHNYPLFCIASISVILISSTCLYLLVKPYPDHTQNSLLGYSDIFTFLGLLLIAVIQFQSLQSHEQNIQNYITIKWNLGLGVIVCLIVSIILLLIELIVSIIRGNQTPQKLEAEQLQKNNQINKNSTPKKIKVFEKREFEGWSCDQSDGQSSSGINFSNNYQLKDSIVR